MHPELSANANLGPDLKWGLGLLLNEKEQPGMRAGRERGPGSSTPTSGVDPVSGITCSVFSQCLPFGDPAVFQV